MPVIDYACSIWGNSTSKNVYLIQRLQNSAARAYCKNYDYINTRGIDLVKRLNWMTVRQRITYFTVSQMFKCIHGLAPQYLCNGIVMECEANARFTRSLQSNNVHIYHFLEPGMLKIPLHSVGLYIEIPFPKATKNKYQIYIRYEMLWGRGWRWGLEKTCNHIKWNGPYDA